MNKITILVPIHKLEEAQFDMVKRAIASIKLQRTQEFKVAFIISPEVDDAYAELLKAELEGLDYNIYVNSKDVDYASQVNLFVYEYLDTPYFSVLQFDDEILENHVMNAQKHIEAYPEYGMFMPLIFEVDGMNNFIGFSNESVWSMGHMTEFGVFDLSNAKKHNFMNYNICGAIIKGEAFINAGGLKSSMRIFQDYEFLLRMIEFGETIYVIPKICYKHINDRVGSIFESLKDVSNGEKKFWYELAKVEYIFDYDRKIEYTL